jgi:hypothetical protein
LSLRIGLFAWGVVLAALGGALAVLALTISLLRVLASNTAAELWADGARIGWLICCLGFAAASVDRLPGVARQVLAERTSDEASALISCILISRDLLRAARDPSRRPTPWAKM